MPTSATKWASPRIFWNPNFPSRSGPTHIPADSSPRRCSLWEKNLATPVCLQFCLEKSTALCLTKNYPATSFSGIMTRFLKWRPPTGKARVTPPRVGLFPGSSKRHLFPYRRKPVRSSTHACPKFPPIYQKWKTWIPSRFP